MRRTTATGDNIDHMPRTDGQGRAFKGSQLQIQIYVNARRTELDAEIRQKIPGLANAQITWLAPLPEDGFREPQDGGFLRLAGLDELEDSLRTYWPKGGPVWDGLASFRPQSHRPGVILLEGKSYPEEMKSSCRATNENSRALIQAAITKTRRKLNAERNTASAWFKRYYQLANRLAHLVWLQDQGVPAWLVLVCFADDARHVATTTRAWEEAILAAGDTLGVDLHDIDGVAHLILCARPRSELIPAAA